MRTVYFLAVLFLIVLLGGCTSEVSPVAKPKKAYEFVELGKQYHSVGGYNGLFSVGGKLGYQAEISNPARPLYDIKKIIVVDSIEHGKEYDAVDYPAIVGGKLAYKALANGKWFIVFDGQELGKEYAQIGTTTIVDIDGKPGFTAQSTKEGNAFFVWDGKEYGKEYQAINCFFAIDGKLACLAAHYGSLRWKAVLGGKEFSEWDEAKSLVNFNGKLAFAADADTMTAGGWRVVIDGVPSGEYDWISELKVIGGKLAVVASEGGLRYLVFDGKEGNPYDSVGELTDIGGKPAYVAYLGRKTFIVFDGKELGRQYESAFEPVDVGGKLAFRANLGYVSDAWNGMKMLVVYDGKEYGREYDRAYDPRSIGGRLAYVAEKDGKQFVVLDGIEGKHYNRVMNLVDVNGKLAYIAEEGDTSVYTGAAGTRFVVFEK